LICSTSWPYLRELGETHAAKWTRYLERLDRIGYVRKHIAGAA